MPVEIRELIIRATVEEPSAGGEAGGKPAAAGSPPTAGERPGAAGKGKAQLVEECVEAVMEILREQRER